MTDWSALTRALSGTMRAHVPEWTDFNESDPGITLLELFALLAEGLDALGVEDPVVVCVNGQAWRRVSSLAEAEADAPVFTFDEATGTLAFGDGVHGRAPRRGDTVFARWRRGSGGAGNTACAVRSTWPLTDSDYRLSMRALGSLQLEGPLPATDQWCGVTRPRYFFGRVLTADTLVEEQEYHRGKHRRHLQALHGWGVVQGLTVSDGADGNSLVVGPGLAIDAHGREIEVCEPVSIAIPPGTLSPASLVLEYVERVVEPVPGASELFEASRIEEGSRLVFTTTASAPGVVIARVVREADGWRVDQEFVARRI